MPNVKMVAVDMDGTFCRSDTTIDEHRFGPVLARMQEVGCHFVVASGKPISAAEGLISWL